MKYYTKIGEQIRKIRKQRGYTQAELAGRLGTTASDISDIERGQKACSIDRLAAIAKALDAWLDVSLTARNTNPKN